jgi:hypothetical protein
VTIKVEVTREDIAADIHAADDCPVARAVLRALRKHGKNPNYVGATQTFVAYHEDFCREEIPLPESVTTWIRKYDLAEQCQPFSFELEMPA